MSNTPWTFSTFTFLIFFHIDLRKWKWYEYVPCLSFIWENESKTAHQHNQLNGELLSFSNVKQTHLTFLTFTILIFLYLDMNTWHLYSNSVKHLAKGLFYSKTCSNVPSGQYFINWKCYIFHSVTKDLVKGITFGTISDGN